MWDLLRGEAKKSYLVPSKLIRMLIFVMDVIRTESVMNVEQYVCWHCSSL